MSELSYSVTRELRGDRIYLKAEPSEWACDILCDIQPPSASWKPESSITEYRISWGTGAFGRNWTFEDARKFFEAGLKLLDMAVMECKQIGAETEAK